MKNSRRPNPEHSTVPPVLPVARMVVQADGSMQVTIDGAPYLPPEYAPTWRRESFPRIIEAITQQRSTGVRVEVTEADGRTFTDLIAPTRRPTQPTPHSQPQPQLVPREAHAQHQPQVVQLAGSGFIPGEGVAVAIIVAYADTAPDGICRVTFDPRQFAGTPANEAILLGRISGTIALGTPA